MKRYIDADNVLKELCNICGLQEYCKNLQTEKRCVEYQIITSEQTADVAPIIHAHWEISLAENGWKDTVCSNCGFTINDDIQVLWNTKYCPECGAIMDEETGK